MTTRRMGKVREGKVRVEIRECYLLASGPGQMWLQRNEFLSRRSKTYGTIFHILYTVI